MAEQEQQKETRTIRFTEVGSKKGVQEVELGPGESLKDLLARQGVTGDREVRVNSNIASDGTELQNDDFVMALPRVVGG